LRLSLRHYLPGAIVAIWSTALSGFAVPLAPDILLAVHLFSGFAGFLLLGAFLARHWWARRASLAGRSNAWSGHIALACLALLFLSGVALLHWTNVRLLQQLHYIVALALLLDLSFHFAWRLVGRASALRLSPCTLRFWKRGRFLRRWLSWGSLTALPLVLMVAFARGWQQPATAGSRPVALAHDTLQGQPLAAASACATCHRDVTAQWQTSAHAHAVTDTYYGALAAMFIQERGVEAVRYCAACHNPVGLARGEISLQAVRALSAKEEEVGAARTAAYEARALGVALPISQQAAEGVTCVLCHQATVTQEPVNGSLQLNAHGTALPTNGFSRLVLRAEPGTHAASFQREGIREAELCGACHNLRTPDGLLLEPTFDEWLASPYPAQGTTCQVCHMPPVAGRRATSTAAGQVAAHGGLPGAPSSLPDIASGSALLRAAATLELDVQWNAGGQALAASVAVTNSGAGHYLPTGADDLREVWLEVTVCSDEGRLLWQSGVLDEHGALPAEAVRFHKVLGDTAGRPIELHRFWLATQILSDTRLAPHERREIRYEIPAAAGQPGPSKLTVRLLYRDVSQAFAEFAVNGPVGDLPVHEMARAEEMLLLP
jgi:hypothetical protein